MVSSVVKVFTGREIIFFNPHRNSNPVLNKENKEKFIFLDPLYLWKATGVFGRKSKARYKAMSFLLTVFFYKIFVFCLEITII